MSAQSDSHLFDEDQPTEPIEQDIEDGAGEYERETKSPRVDSKTLKARRFSSDFVAVLRDLSASLGFSEDDQLTLQTLMDASRRADYLPDESKPEGGTNMPSLHRRFHAAAWLLELYHRRQMLPQGLSKEEETRLKDTLTRAWSRRWKPVEERQRRLHLALFLKEGGGEMVQGARQASAWTDRLTDLVNDIIRRSRELRDRMPVKRIARARGDALAAFREQFPKYAPDWIAPCAVCQFINGVCEVCGKAEPQKDETEDADIAAPYLAMARKLAKQGRAFADERGMSEDEQVDFRLRLQQEIETAWLGKTVDADSPRLSLVPPVTNRPDKSKNASAAPQSNRTDLSGWNDPKTPETSAKTPNVEKVDAPQLDSPEDTARKTVHLLESVGAVKFKVVFLSMIPLAGGEPKVKAFDDSSESLKRKLVGYVRRSDDNSESLCLRPQECPLIQVDDCSANVVESLRPFSFMVAETSPGNFQCWLALASGTSDESRVALRDRLLRKFKENKETANGGAYNSIRLPGCINAKEKYRKQFGEFPRVRLVSAAEGRVVAPGELELAGLLAPVEQPKAAPKIERVVSGKAPTHFPDFNTYLQKHWKQDENRPDRSSAEAAFACAAARMGHDRHAIISELARVSLKQKGRRDSYIEKTVDHALAWIARQPDTSSRGGRERVTL